MKWKHWPVAMPADVYNAKFVFYRNTNDANNANF
jgi:hypothetical protein